MEMGLGDLLFCFGIVLHLEDVDHQCLSVLAHVAEHDSLGFVEWWVWR